MTIRTSNRLTDLSQRIREARDRAMLASVESAEQSLEAGRLLIEAKEACQHGQWIPFLESTGIHERQARRLMQLARSGLKADTVSDLGGVKAALEYLAEKKQPEPVDLDTYLHGPRPYEPGEIEVPVADVVFRRNLYPRMQFRLDLVDRYKEFLPELPPIEINQRSELIDGWHRLEAHKQAGVTTIRAVVTEVENDIEHLETACYRNSRHGVQLPLSVERQARAAGRVSWPLQRPQGGEADAA